MVTLLGVVQFGVVEVVAGANEHYRINSIRNASSMINNDAEKEKKTWNPQLLHCGHFQ